MEISSIDIGAFIIEVLLWANYPALRFFLDGPMFRPMALPLGLWALIFLGYTIALPVACHVCHENAPRWRGSVAMMAGIVCLSSVFLFASLLLLAFLPIPALNSFGAIFGVTFVLGALLQGGAAGVVYAGILPGVTFGKDRKSTRLNSSHSRASRMPSSA